MSRFRLRTGQGRVTVRHGQPPAGTTLPAGHGSFTVTGQSTSLTSSAGGGVIYDVSSTDVVDVVLVGSDPGSHGLHVDHSPHPARFFGDVTKTAISDGDWSDPDIWSPSGVPGTGDVVRVPSKLTFDPASNTKLTCNLLAVNEDGELVIDYSASSNTAEVVIADTEIDTELDPEQWGQAFIGLGKVTVKGKTKTAWARLAGHALAGDTVLTLASAVSGWAVGDRVMLSDTSAGLPSVDPASPNHLDNIGQFDVRLISDVSPDGLTVTLGSALTHHHRARFSDVLDQITNTCPVANLSSNVLVRSENPTGTRGHVVFHGRATVDVQDVEFRDTGRTLWEPLSESNPKARYQLHCHHLLGPTGLAPEVPQFKLARNSVWNSTNRAPGRWGIAIHGSSYGDVSGNVVYNVLGSGIVTEDGTERNNTIDGNLVVRCQGTGTGENSRGTGDVAHSGQGMWLASGENYVTNNVVLCAQKGITFSPYMVANPQATRLPASKGADPATDYTEVHIQRRPILQFEDNEVGCRMESGLDIWALNSILGLGNPEADVSYVDGLRVWHVNLGYYNYMTTSVRFRGCHFDNGLDVLRQRQGGGIAFFQSDYIAEDFEIVDCTIEGFLVGWFVNFGEVMRATTNTWCNYRDIEFRPTWGAGSGAEAVPPREVTLSGNTFIDPACDTFSDWGSQGGVVMDGRIHAHNANLIHDDIVYLLNHTDTNDYRLYYPEQQADASLQESEFVSPGVARVLGASESGLTNAQSFALDGVCFANKITPEGTTTLSRIVGDAELI